MATLLLTTMSESVNQSNYRQTWSDLNKVLLIGL